MKLIVAAAAAAAAAAVTSTREYQTINNLQFEETAVGGAGFSLFVNFSAFSSGADV